MKKALSLFLALILCLSLSLPALAAAPTDADQENAAWTLYHMGLFQGTDTDKEGFPVFSLSDSPTRAQGVTMLVRLLGQEKAALEGTWSTPFTDVPEWAQPYVGYAYEKGLTNGTGETTFSADKTLSATEYLTLVLRALGYDSASDFAWDSAWTLTDKLGITNQVYSAATTTLPPGRCRLGLRPGPERQGKGQRQDPGRHPGRPGHPGQQQPLCLEGRLRHRPEGQAGLLLRRHQGQQGDLHQL